MTNTTLAPSAVPPGTERFAPAESTRRELKRGAFFNTVAMIASNLNGIFTFLIARLLGPASLGAFSVAWSTTDIISKLAVFGFDNTITTFIAQSQARGEHARSRRLFRLAVGIGAIQSAGIALLAVLLLRAFGNRLGLQSNVIAALSVVVCALPGIALYRISTSVSRGMKVMQHDIFSRGMTEPIMTTLVFLTALALGLKTFAPELAAIVGTGSSGIVALCLAASLFRGAPAAKESARIGTDIRGLFGYATPITIYQMLNAIIIRLDVVMLGCYIGRAPGVTLVTVGVYGAVVDLAVGLRKVNQAFNPIFTPVVAGMTATGDQRHAAATYAHIAQWMLWILLPLVAVMVLAGSTILLIFGPAFAQGGLWLAIVAVACATNAFVSLGEVVIMVQRPRLNLINSSIACAATVALNLWLIPHYGVTGAALGVLAPFTIQGLLRYGMLRFIFHWPNPWSEISPPILAAVIAALPALACRILIHGWAGQIVSALAFLILFGSLWLYYRKRSLPNE